MNKDKLIKLGYKIEEVEIDDPHWNSSIHETRIVCPDNFKFIIREKIIDIKDSEFVKREKSMRAFQYTCDNTYHILDQVEAALVKNPKAKRIIINIK